MQDTYKEIFERKKTEGSNGKIGFVPDYNYYPLIFNAVDGVIAPLTTMGIEAMLAGKPVMLKAFFDEKNDFNPIDMFKLEQHKCWDQMPSVIKCQDKEIFIDDCKRLVGLIESGSIKDQVRGEVREVVYYDDLPYSERLYKCVYSILGN